jgi:hydroxyacylglutathione hydrolase
MLAAQTLKDLSFDEAIACVDNGAAFVDLRRPGAYLEVHIPGSLCLVYEFGPGMASRARDCLPLDLPFVLMDLGDEFDYVHAAASLRGKGFTVLGKLEDALNAWASERGVPASTDITSSTISGTGTVLDVRDAGAPHMEDAVSIPVDQLWQRVDELGGPTRVAVLAGYGVRAALAIGILERAGIAEIIFFTKKP